MNDRPKRAQDITFKDTTSPRYRRAVQFTHMILATMRDFVPSGRECWRLMEDHLFEIAYEMNVEIISVPPELDELDKRHIELHMLEAKMGPWIKLEGPCPKCGQATWLTGQSMCDKGMACPVRF